MGGAFGDDDDLRGFHVGDGKVHFSPAFRSDRDAGAATSAFPETTAVITESKLMSSMTSSLPVRRATSRMISGSMPMMAFPSRNS